jgi:predicted peptidase
VRFVRKTLLLPFVSTAMLALLAAAPARAAKKETGFLDRTVSIAGADYKYQVFVPADWTPKKKWPIILFLHGAGERGADGLVETEVGIATAIRRDRTRFPAIVVMPQCKPEMRWTEPAMAELAMKSLEDARKEFHGDPAHTYLTGLSLGGYGTWYLAAQYPRMFAAIVPICGGVLYPDKSRVQSAEDKTPYSNAAKLIGPQPVWIFHGGSDDTVPVAESQRMAEAMKAQGGEVHYSEYPGVGHNSWDKAYAEPELIAWMLSKTLTAPKH